MFIAPAGDKKERDRTGTLSPEAQSYKYYKEVVFTDIVNLMRGTSYDFKPTGAEPVPESLLHALSIDGAQAQLDVTVSAEGQRHSDKNGIVDYKGNPARTGTEQANDLMQVTHTT